MGRNTEVNAFLLEDQIQLVRETWKKGMNAMKDSGSKDPKSGKFMREADWTTRIKMMAFWKDCTVIRSRDVDNAYRTAKANMLDPKVMEKVRKQQQEYQKKVN